MADLDRLSIQIEANTRGASNQIDKLSKRLESLSAVIDKIDSSKFEGLARATSNLSQGLSGLKGSNVKQIAKVGEALENIKSNDNAFTNVVEGAKDLGENSEKATTDIYNILGALKSGGESTVFQSVNKQLEEFSGKALTSESSVKGLKGMLASLKIIIPTQELDKTQKKFEKIKEKAQELSEQIDFKSKTVESYVDSKAMEADKAKLEGLINEMERLKLKQKELESHGAFQFNTASLRSAKKLFSEIGSNIGIVASKAVRLVGTFAGIPWLVNGIGNSVKKLKSHFDNLGKSLGRIYKMARLMVVRKILQAVIKNAITGFNNLVQYSDKFDTSVSLLWNSMRQLGNAVASAVAPLVNALAPALNMIIQLCIKAVNAINQLISALTGNGTWTKAKTLSDDYAKSLDKSNKSAKALKKTILGFDEINKLDDNTDSRSGGLTPPSDMFEEAKVGDKWKNIADWLKGMWDDADFTELGKALGEKLLTALKSIPWDKIKAEARKLGSSLATLINGFIEVDGLGYEIGKTLAEAINTGFEFLNEFVHKLHWESVGKFIADTLNGFFESIDWELIKDTVITGVKGLSASINSFIENFHWDNISTTISNAVNTLAEAVLTFFTDTKFKELGEKLGEQLRKTVEEIEWEKVGEAIGSILQSAFDFAKGLLTPETLSAFKDAISDLLKGFFEKVDKEDLAKVIAAVVGGALTLSVGKLLAGEAVKRVGEKIIAAVFGGSAVATAGSKAAGSAVEGALLGTAQAPPNPLISACKTLGKVLVGVYIGSAITDGIMGVMGKASEWIFEKQGYSQSEIDELMKPLREAQTEYAGLEGKVKLLKDGFSEMKKTFFGADEDVKKFNGTVSEGAIAVEKLSTTTGNLNGSGLKSFADSTRTINIEIDGMKSSMSGAQESIGKTKKSFEELGKSTTTIKMKPLSDEVTNVASKVKDASSDCKASFESLSNSAKDSVASVQLDLNNIKVENLVNEVTLANTKTKESCDGIKQNVTLMKESVSAEMSYMSGNIESGWNTITNTTNESSSNVKKTTDDLKSCFDKDKWTLSGVWEGIEATFNNAIEIAKEIWNRLADWINEKAKIHIDPITIMGKTIFDGADFTLFELPKFRAGGFPEDGLFMANHGEMVGKFSNGKTAVANNEQITDGIAKAVYSAMMSANSSNGSGQYINNTIQIDGETIARAVTKGQQSINRRYSPTVAY